MKKIYSKFTKERVEKFQIETGIYLDESGKKIVKKHPLNMECENHIAHLAEVYEAFKSQGIEEFTPCHMEGNSVVFPFVNGKSLYAQLIEAAKDEDTNKVEAILKTYKELVEKLYPVTDNFQFNPEFESVFGEFEFSKEETAVYNLDIDLTFDNIITDKEGNTRILDYEWTFGFQIPLKFAYYRAIFALDAKHHDLFTKVMPADKMYDYFKVTKELQDQFYQMNQNFMKYVLGGVDSYESILSRYQKRLIKVEELIAKTNRFTQVLFNEGHGYHEENGKNFYLGMNQHKVSIEYEFGYKQKLSQIRIDPLNESVFIKMKTLKLVSKDKELSLTLDQVMHNAIKINDDKYVFEGDDPQIIVDIKRENAWTKIIVEFDILLEDMEEFQEYVTFYKEKTTVLKEKSYQKESNHQQELAGLQQQLSQKEERIRVLEDKIRYIESTKGYKMFVNKKVKNTGLWEE